MRVTELITGWNSIIHWGCGFFGPRLAVHQSELARVMELTQSVGLIIRFL